MGLFLDTVPKVSGFLVKPGSHYWLNMLNHTHIRVSGVGADLNAVLAAINDVERFLGLSVSTWHTTLDGKLGDPAKWIAPHQMVNLGGNSANVGTLREAVERCRDARSEVPAWSWKACATRAMFLDPAQFHRFELGVSAAGLLELYEAAGRIVKSGGRHSYQIHLHRDIRRSANMTASDCEGTYSVGVGPSPIGMGTDGKPRVWQMDRLMGTSGYYEEQHNATRGIYPRPEPQPPDETSVITRHVIPGFRTCPGNFAAANPTGESSWEAPDYGAVGLGDLYVRIFKLSDEEDDDIEAFEAANTDKWELLGASGVVDGVVSQLADLEKPTNYFRTYGVAAKTGPAMNEFGVRPVDIPFSRWSGILGWESTPYHFAYATPQDYYGSLCGAGAGPDCDWVWTAQTQGPGWPHLTPAMTDQSVYPMGKPMPLFPITNADAITDFTDGGLGPMGNMTWRTSAQDPMEGYYPDEYDYTVAGAHRTALRAIMSRLNSGTEINVGVVPAGYVWAWPAPGTFTGPASLDFMEWQATDSPGGSGSPSWSVIEPPALIDAFEGYIDEAEFDPVTRDLEPWVTRRYERFRAEYMCVNQMKCEVTCETVPTDGVASGDSWLYWTEDELSEAVARV